MGSFIEISSNDFTLNICRPVGQWAVVLNLCNYPKKPYDIGHSNKLRCNIVKLVYAYIVKRIQVVKFVDAHERKKKSKRDTIYYLLFHSFGR